MNTIIRFTFLTLSTICVAIPEQPVRNNPGNNPGYWEGRGQGFNLGAAERHAPAIARAPARENREIGHDAPKKLPFMGPVDSKQVYVLGQDEVVITKIRSSPNRVGEWIDIEMVSPTARFFLYPRYTLTYLKEGPNIARILDLKHEWPTFTKPTANTEPVMLMDELKQKLNTNSLVDQRVALKKIYITNVSFDGPENVYFNPCDETGIKEHSWLPQSWRPLTIFLEGQTYKVKRTLVGDKTISVSNKEPIWFPIPTQNATRAFWVTSGALGTLVIQKGLAKIKK